jgi:hypothetical protein
MKRSTPLSCRLGPEQTNVHEVSTAFAVVPASVRASERAEARNKA